MPRETPQNSCVGTGFIVLDIIRDLAGSTANEVRYAGGSCGNVLTILAYLDWRTNAIGRIGDDPAGNELLCDLEKWGVKTNFLNAEAGRATPVIVQENYIDARGAPRHRFLRRCPTCGATLPAFRPVLKSEVSRIAKHLPAHSVFYFDRVVPGALELAQLSRSKGALVVFEPSGIKNERLFTECLKVSHVIKYANDRIKGIHDIVSNAKVPVSIETRGVKGLELRFRGTKKADGRISLPAFPVTALRDSVGSGDWTTAGLIYRLMLEKESVGQLMEDKDAIVNAVRYGQVLAALNCGYKGARGLMYDVSGERLKGHVQKFFNGTIALDDPSLRLTREDGGVNIVSSCELCSIAD